MNGLFLYELAGFLGVAFYLGSYAALQAGLLRGNGYAYAGYNLAAAMLVLTSLVANFNLWSAIIQVSWITISIVGMARTYIIANALTLAPEERDFLSAKFAGLSPGIARKLVRAGEWRDLEPGEILTREGEPVPALAFIKSGGASVTVGGRTVAHCGPGTLVGEFGIASGKPAIATVTVDAPSRLLTISAGEMSRIIRRNPTVQMALDAAIGAEAREKLAAANARATAPGSSP